MKWINSLKDSKIEYFTYKLSQNDSIIVFNKRQSKDQLIIILYGSLYIVKIFKNKKIRPIVILNTNSIFSNYTSNRNFYYKLVALEKTYILNIKINNKEKVPIINTKFLNNIIISYNKTINIHQSIQEAVKHKYVTNRVIQIILLLFFQFGIVSKKQIYLPFKFSQKNLALISNTSQGTISKIIKKIISESTLKYCSKQSIYIQNLFNLK